MLPLLFLHHWYDIWDMLLPFQADLEEQEKEIQIFLPHTICLPHPSWVCMQSLFTVGQWWQNASSDLKNLILIAIYPWPLDMITGASLCTIPICNISFLLQVLTVCILFIRFSRIDATDSAVLRSTNRRSRRGLIFTPAPVHDVLSCTDTNTGPSVNKASATQDMVCCISCCAGSCFPDNEWRKELSCFTDNESWGDRQPQHHEFVEEILFCSICKAEVF